MKRIAKMYNSEERDCIVKLTSRSDKSGNIFFCVQYQDDYATFSHLSSALDFINSNFKS